MVASSCTIGGTECGVGKSCVGAANVERTNDTYCKVDGAGIRGADCLQRVDGGRGGCGPNLTCFDGACRNTCSPQRPCDAGTCNVTFQKNGPGRCL